MMLSTFLSDGAGSCEKEQEITWQKIHSGAGHTDQGRLGSPWAGDGCHSVGHASDFSLDDGDDETVCAAAVQAEKIENMPQQMSINKKVCEQHAPVISEIKNDIKQYYQREVLESDMKFPAYMASLVSPITCHEDFAVVTSLPASVTASALPSSPPQQPLTSSVSDLSSVSVPSCHIIMSATAIQANSAANSVLTRTSADTPSIFIASESMPPPTSKPEIASTIVPILSNKQPFSRILCSKQKQFLYPSERQIERECLNIENDTTVNVIGKSSLLKTISALEPSLEKMTDVLNIDTVMDFERIPSVEEYPNQRNVVQEPMVRPSETTCHAAEQSHFDVDTETGPPRKIPKLLGFAKFSDVFQTSVGHASSDTLVTKNQSCISSSSPLVPEANKSTHVQSSETPCLTATKSDGDHCPVRPFTQKEVKETESRLKENKEYPCHESSSFAISENRIDHLERSSELATATGADLLKLSSVYDTDLLKLMSTSGARFNSLAMSSTSSCKVEEDVCITSQVWMQTEFSQMLTVVSGDEMDGCHLESKNIVEHSKSFQGENYFDEVAFTDDAHICEIYKEKVAKVATSCGHDSLDKNGQLSPESSSSKCCVPSDSGTHSVMLSNSNIPGEDNLEGKLENIFNDLKHQLKSRKKFIAPFLSRKSQDKQESVPHQQLKASIHADQKKSLKLVSYSKLREIDQLLVQMESDIQGTEGVYFNNGHESSSIKMPLSDRADCHSWLAVETSAGTDMVQEKSRSSDCDKNGVCSGPDTITLDQTLAVGAMGFSTASGRL